MRASDNSHLKSSAFEDKRLSFAKSPYSLTRGIAEAKEWMPEQIIGRQQKLAELAPKAWPV
jgi:hypothetical protein